MLDWARSGWSQARWLDPDRHATAVVGHSRGASVGLRVVVARPEIGAFMSLSGIGLRSADLGRLRTPAFFMWTRNFTGLLEDPGWDGLPTPKYGALIDEGQHYDYVSDLPGCSEPRGQCDRIAGLTGDLASLFITRYLRSSAYTVPIDLQPRFPTLTERQADFAGGRLGFIESFDRRAGCGVALRWDDGTTRGSRRLGP